MLTPDTVRVAANYEILAVFIELIHGIFIISVNK
ncbi:hypothetical protein Nos7107_5412 [Nostoc sp. PCC 7107]|nr:hypothetical protein Nos7107_5412 [Nostoc sp. PCC 7107]